MPIGKESVINRALTGAELRKRIEADLTRLLDAEGALATQMAFGRCAYSLRLTLYTGNFLASKSETFLDSRSVARQEIEGESRPGMPARAANPVLRALESFPLRNPPADARLSARTITREITSPNTERVRLGLPVPIERKQPDGTTTTEEIHYPKEMAQDAGEGVVTVEDTTEEARRELAQRRA